MIFGNVKKSLLSFRWLILTVIILAYIGSLYTNKIFFIRFADEEDNLVMGNYLLDGQKLYSDLFSHHQPYGYILSASFQWTAKPDSIHLLVKQHREFMIVWAFLWCLTLIFRFKEKVILPLIVFELTKFFLLGNLFLSESLAVYPVLYLILFLINKSGTPNNKELFFTSMLIGFTGLLLAPLWPMLLAYLVFMVWFKKIRVNSLLLVAEGILLPLIIALPFIDIYYYFHNVFYINYKYYIPQSAEEKLPWSFFKALFTPLSVFLVNNNSSSFGFILRIIGIFFFISVAYLVKKKKFRLLLVALTLMTLANLRYYSPGLEYTSGFHLLIWYAVFVVIAFYFYNGLLEGIKHKAGKFTLIGLAFLAVATIILNSKDVFKKNNLTEDYIKNYSKQEIFSQAIKSMRSSGDTLFVIPDEWLLYFGGDVKNNNKMVNFYGWMSLVWELNDPVLEKFKTNPPEFFYCDCSEDVMSNYSNHYHQLIRNGEKTPLWVLNDKYLSLNVDQKTRLRELNFALE